MGHALKTAISLAAPDFEYLEKIRRAEKKTRSEVIQEALHLWRKQREIQELEAKYLEGYKKHPEKIDRRSSPYTLFRAGLHSFSREKW